MYHWSSRSRRRGEPQGTAGLGGDEAWMSAARAEGNFRCPQWPNASSVTSAHSIGFSAEENSFAPEFRQNSSKKVSGISMKQLLDEEASKPKETMHHSPSLVARLMGLDTLPYSVRKQKHFDRYNKITASTNISPNYKHSEDYSHGRSMDNDQEFKDVFEVVESKIKKRTYQSDNRRLLDRGNETVMKPTRQKFIGAKGFSTHEVLHKEKKFNHAFEISESSKDLFRELLQDPNSLIAKHLQDLSQAPTSPHRSKITVLKPTRGAKYWSDDVWSQLSELERNHDKCFNMQQQLQSGSVKMHAASLDEIFVSEKFTSLPNNSPVLQHADGTKECPAHIVILKPNLEKAKKATKDYLFTHDDFWYTLKKFRELAKYGTQELQSKSKAKLSYQTEVLSNSNSIEISREITRKTRCDRTSRTKTNFNLEKKYAVKGDPDIFPVPAVKLDQPESICSSSNYGEWGNCFSPPSPSYPTRSSVSREARKRLSERWKMTHQSQNTGHTPGNSSTLGELLALSNNGTSKVTLHASNAKNDVDEKFPCNEVLGSKGCFLATNSKDSLKDVYSRLFPLSNSLTVSSSVYRSPKFSDPECNGGTNDMGSSTSSDANFSKPEKSLVKTSNHCSHKSQQAHFVENEYMVPEREIHVNSEGLRKSINVRNYMDERTIHPLPTEYSSTDMNQSKVSASIPVLGDESEYLTTMGKQEMLSAFQMPFGNEGKIKEISTDHPQVEQVLSEDVAESNPLSIEELEQTSPISVLETPSEDETYGSGCFERLSSDLKELRAQLQLLKLESVDTCIMENEALWGNGNCAMDDHSDGVLPSREVQQNFRDDDDRDYAYLLDMLIESGFLGVGNNKLLNGCCFPSYPMDQNVFDQLEKKYNGDPSWSISERKLLFDVINCSLAGLVANHLDEQPWVTSNIRRLAWDQEGLVETLWQMVVKQRKEMSCNWGNVLVLPEWISLECGIDAIGRGIERMLNNDLLEELAREFIENQ
ncbi:hypothetical protein Cni_G25041 [Canna indica]|uniref:DUF4378 domain-containing protein n=1 Tax=Canna indica TaxID=4628 RepID=A0AAQ3KWV5_9LILI|nr:hypothetical protein Cni_G25041 [Canna indica]